MTIGNRFTRPRLRRERGASTKDARWLAACALALGAVTLPVEHAAAQPAPAQPAAQPAKGGDAPVDEKELGPGDDAVKSKPDPLFEALAPAPGGLTFDQVAREAIATSAQVKGKQSELDGSEGAVSQTMVSFFPRLTLTASYTRLSETDPPSIGSGAIVGALNEGAITVGPCPQAPTTQCALDAAGVPIGAQKFSLSSSIPDQIQFTAGLTVPITDYFLRAVQAYNAASHNEETLKMQLEAQRLTVAADAKLALLSWVLARGQSIVAQKSVEQANAQLADIKATLAAEKASKADVLRVEALVAQNEFTLAEAKALELTAEQRLRTVLHTNSDRQLAIGVDVFATPAVPALPKIDVLVAEAVKNRLDILSLEEQRRALEEVESTTAAGYWPRIDGFADLLVADPNQRIFPQQDRFDATWDVGVRLTWVVNDTFSTIGATAQSRAKTAQIEATRQQLIDAARLEVTQAYADVLKATPSIEAANRNVTAAEETLRVTKKVFAIGNVTGTTLADAENALTGARLRKLSAYVGLQAALVRLDHATGRDRGAPLAAAASAAK